MSLPVQSVAQMSNERDRSLHLFEIKISRLSKTLKSLKGGGVFVKLVMLLIFFIIIFPNTEAGALFRGKKGTSYETHDKNSLLKAFCILICNSH